MKRTQLYIDDHLFEALSHLGKEKKTSVSDLVRKALEKVYGNKKSKSSFQKALKSSAGICKNKEFKNTDAYIRSVRKDSRSQRLGLK